MKVILVLLGLVGFASSQVVVPEKGWRKIGEGEKDLEGLKALGVWDNTDNSKGDVMLGVAWGRELPTFGEFLGLKPEEDASVGIIEHAEILEKPRLGLRIKYLGRKKSNRSRNTVYWIYGKDGGVLLSAIHDKDAEFLLGEWNAEGIPEDQDGQKRRDIKELVDAMNATKALPPIKIDGDLMPPKKAAKTEGGITIEVKKNGTYYFEGKEVKYRDLEKRLKVAVMKHEKKDPEIKPLLYIEAEKEVEFKYVQRVIKAAAKAGIKQLSYAAFGQEVEK